jgi:hypothetical protein
MPLHPYDTALRGKPVVVWRSVEEPIADPTGVAYRIAESDDTGLLRRFLQMPNASAVTTLLIPSGAIEEGGEDTESEAGEDDSDEEDDGTVVTYSPLVNALAASADQLPNLTTLFVGNTLAHESELSWHLQSDLSPLLTAFPHLEYLGIRGTHGLALGGACLPALKSLVIQTGDMPTSVLDEVLALELPALEHLELWLGSADYDSDDEPAAVKRLLAGAEQRWPNLKYLGLRNSNTANEDAVQVSLSPLLKQLEVLDLSLGTLGDPGIEALLESDGIHQLKKLDIHHHYVSEEAILRLKALDIEVDASEPQNYEE